MTNSFGCSRILLNINLAKSEVIDVTEIFCDEPIIAGYNGYREYDDFHGDNATYAQMIAKEAIEEWNAGHIQCDLSDIVIE